MDGHWSFGLGPGVLCVRGMPGRLERESMLLELVDDTLTGLGYLVEDC